MSNSLNSIKYPMSNLINHFEFLMNLPPEFSTSEYNKIRKSRRRSRHSLKWMLDNNLIVKTREEPCKITTKQWYVVFPDETTMPNSVWSEQDPIGRMRLYKSHGGGECTHPIVEYRCIGTEIDVHRNYYRANIEGIRAMIDDMQTICETLLKQADKYRMHI